MPEIGEVPQIEQKAKTNSEQQPLSHEGQQPKQGFLRRIWDRWSRRAQPPIAEEGKLASEFIRLHLERSDATLKSREEERRLMVEARKRKVIGQHDKRIAELEREAQAQRQARLDRLRQEIAKLQGQDGNI